MQILPQTPKNQQQGLSFRLIKTAWCQMIFCQQSLTRNPKLVENRDTYSFSFPNMGGAFNRLAQAGAVALTLGGAAAAGELEDRKQALDESVSAFNQLVKPLEAEMGVRVVEVLEDPDYCYLISNEDTAIQCGALAEQVEMAALDLQISQERSALEAAETREVGLDSEITEAQEDLEVANTVLAALRRVTQ